MENVLEAKRSRVNREASEMCGNMRNEILILDFALLIDFQRMDLLKRNTSQAFTHRRYILWPR